MDLTARIRELQDQYKGLGMESANIRQRIAGQRPKSGLARLLRLRTADEKRRIALPGETARVLTEYLHELPAVKGDIEDLLRTRLISIDRGQLYEGVKMQIPSEPIEPRSEAYLKLSDLLAKGAVGFIHTVHYEPRAIATGHRPIVITHGSSYGTPVFARNMNLMETLRQYR